MKKMISLTLVLFMLSLFASCGNADKINGDISGPRAESCALQEASAVGEIFSNEEKELLEARISELEKTVAELEESGNADRDELEALAEKYKEYKDELDKKGEENSELYDTIAELNKRINDVAGGNATVSTDYIAAQTYIIYTNYLRNLCRTVAVAYPDGMTVPMTQRKFTVIKLSPNRTKIIANEFDFEVRTNIYLYDVNKRETTEFTLPGLKEHYTPSEMEWIDDRYFLFVSQFDSGTVVRGGDVYVFDTETFEYRPIFLNTSSHYQVSDMTVYGNEFVLFTSKVYDENYPYTENRRTIVTMSELYDMIFSGTVSDLGDRETVLRPGMPENADYTECFTCYGDRSSTVGYGMTADGNSYIRVGEWNEYFKLEEPAAILTDLCGACGLTVKSDGESDSDSNGCVCGDVATIVDISGQYKGNTSTVTTITCKRGEGNAYIKKFTLDHNYSEINYTGGVWFYDADNGALFSRKAKYSNILLRTTDGGLTWKEIYFKLPVAGYFEFAKMISENVGIARLDNTSDKEDFTSNTFVTLNGGYNWTLLSEMKATFENAETFDNNKYTSQVTEFEFDGSKYILTVLIIGESGGRTQKYCSADLINWSVFNG